MHRVKKLLRRRSRSRGAAVVEFAVVTPLLLTMLFGIIEYGYIFLVRQTLQNAAREGCRIAVLQTTTEPYTNVIERVNELMSSVGASGHAIDMTHATAVNPVETVEVSVPLASVSLVGNFFNHGSGDRRLTGKCSMRKEGMGVVVEE